MTTTAVLDLSSKRTILTQSVPDVVVTADTPIESPDAFYPDKPFWKCVIAVKRDIKRMRKDLKRKEELLSAYFQNVVDLFDVSPDSS